MILGCIRRTLPVGAPTQVIYAWGVPLFRTLSFAASWTAQIIMVLEIFRIV